MIILYDMLSKNGRYHPLTQRIRYGISSYACNQKVSHSNNILRYALNYKSIPFKTEFIEYPDIELVSKKIGAGPTGKLPDGKPLYTVPLIYDEDTKIAVSNTIDIAIYLDERFPDTPRIVAPGTKGLQLAFIDTIYSILGGWTRPLWFPLLVGVTEGSGLLNEPSAKHLVHRMGSHQRISDEDYAKHVDQGEAEFARITPWYGEKVFVTGAKPSIADFSVASVLIAAREIWGEESEAYKKIFGWQDGRWKTLVDTLRKYE
jgi:glutathione S-transferase